MKVVGLKKMKELKFKKCINPLETGLGVLKMASNGSVQNIQTILN